MFATRADRGERRHSASERAGSFPQVGEFK
jgi:hypothetical protein